MDLVISDPNFDLENTDKEQQLELCFNILPRGRGILHKLALGDVGDGNENPDTTKIGD